jgi:Replication-relaxation
VHGSVPLVVILATAGGLLAAGCAPRLHARSRRRYVRVRIAPYRTDQATPDAVVAVFDALHRGLLQRWWRRVRIGQPSVALEAHVLTGPGGRLRAELAVSCPQDKVNAVELALQCAYPNARLERFPAQLARPPYVLRLKKRAEFITRLRVPDPRESGPPLVDRLLAAMRASGGPCLVQLALTPTPAWFERSAKQQFRRREQRASPARTDGEHRTRGRASEVDAAELRGALDVQHRPLFFADLRIVAATRIACEDVAAVLRTSSAENQLVERGTTIRQALLRPYDRRVWRGEGNPLPGYQRCVYASTELAMLWQLPSVGFSAVPLQRTALPIAPASPAIARPRGGGGLLRDALGPVSIHPDLRRQNTAVPGTIEQGKTSYLVATIHEDLRRERCAVIVLDPKGDAADAAISAVPQERTCTILDFAQPTCGFNPLAVDASPDTVADYVVAAMRNLFDEGDIRASSDRYLRNAIIAVLAYDRRATLWDAVRLLSVTEEGYAYRTRVGQRLRGLPEFKEIGDFFTEELRAQLRDAKSMTTSKLDAPVNKAARLLNSPSIKRVLQNRSLTVDFDRIIASGEVLVVKGALGAVGTGNTSVLMQLLVGMLDAALSRQQDGVSADERTAVALKVDEAPLVINRGFAQTMALKRSAGLETVACWQTDAQWIDPEVRPQLDALFAHRVYFATASAEDARAATDLMMAAYSDQVRSADHELPILGSPDVRLHLPKHYALASWVTPEGRQPTFIAQTSPVAVDPERVAWHHRRQHARGGRELESFRQPHWDRDDQGEDPHVDVAQSAVAGGDEPARAGRASHRSDPTGERERDDFAELRDLLRAEAAQRTRTAPSASCEPSDTVDQSPARASAASVRKPSTGEPPASYAELVAVDEATRVTWPRKTERRTVTPDPIDLELLGWLTELRFALATQIHRRFGAGKSYSTTQRRLKKLSQAGWVQRFQFFRDTGASSALTYLVTDAGIATVRDAIGPHGPYLDPRREWSAPSTDDPAMRRARHDLHVNAWGLALESQLGEAVRRIRGPRTSYVAPPTRSSGGERRAIGPDELRLPGGRTPHRFLRTDRARQRVEVEEFAAIEPDLTIELRLREAERIAVTDLFVELDRTFKPAKNIDKFERYDHMISGWCTLKDRYAKHCTAPPLVVFVCRDQANAKEFCRAADPVVSAAHAYGGEYASEWRYPGRDGMLFVAERDVHDGRLLGYALPTLPPEVRAAVVDDRSARACHPRQRRLLAVAGAS